MLVLYTKKVNFLGDFHSFIAIFKNNADSKYLSIDFNFI